MAETGDQQSSGGGFAATSRAVNRVADAIVHRLEICFPLTSQASRFATCRPLPLPDDVDSGLH